MDALSSANNKNTSEQSVPQWITSYGWLLTVSFVISQPFRHLFELPVALMAGLGLWLLTSQARTVLTSPAFKALLIMFACIWLPMLFSLTDAFNFSRSAQTTLVFLRFPLTAIFILYSLQNAVSRTRLLMTTGIALSLAVLWLIGMAASGHYHDGLVSDIPFPIGQFLGVMAPILFFWIFRLAQKNLWIWLILPLSSAALLFSGSRSAWIMFAVALLLFLLQLFISNKVRSDWRTGLVILVLLSLGVGVAIHIPTMKARIDQTAGLFSGNYDKANSATSLRLPIWAVATRVAKDHWINGIGPRGFRYIYPKYVPKDDFWLVMPIRDKFGNIGHPEFGPNHPHQFFLEVAAETGVIGVLGYIFALVYWIRLGIKANQDQMQAALPWMAAVFVAIMPINSHMAFYASFWSCITWWLIAVSLAYWQAGPAKEQLID